MMLMVSTQFKFLLSDGRSLLFLIACFFSLLEHYSDDLGI